MAASVSLLLAVKRTAIRRFTAATAVRESAESRRPVLNMIRFQSGEKLNGEMAAKNRRETNTGNSRYLQTADICEFLGDDRGDDNNLYSFR